MNWRCDRPCPNNPRGNLCLADVESPPRCQVINDPLKNCDHCANLEWGHGDVNDPEGWMCNGRKYTCFSDEAVHLKKLGDRAYRAREKKCFVPRKVSEEKAGI